MLHFYHYFHWQYVFHRITSLVLFWLSEGSSKIDLASKNMMMREQAEGQARAVQGAGNRREDRDIGATGRTAV